MKDDQAFSGLFESSTISVLPVCLHASVAAVFVCQFVSTQVIQRIVNLITRRARYRVQMWVFKVQI